MNYKRELTRFESYLRERVQPGTADAYVYSLERWFKTLNGNEPSQEQAQRYIDVLAKTKSPSTANLRAHAILRWFKWKKTPISLDCPTIRLGEPKYLNAKELTAVMGACTNALEKVLIVVLFDTAVRVSELLSIKTSDIDRAGGFITVDRKGGRTEEVNISDKGLWALDEWLEARLSKSKMVFDGLSRWEAWNVVRGVGKRAGIPLNPHMMRHSRAIQMMKQGATLHDVQGHLGHRTIATTADIYGRYKAADLKEKIPSW